jgi:D-glycero-D-manno-heptose 1,7-bisphosphate phosphatase
MRAAVFFDRDGTLIEDVPYLSDPAKVRLIDGAAEAIRNLQALDYACVVVTNQSAVGRGMLSEPRLAEIHAEMYRQFAAQGVKLDGLYYCPLAPSTPDRTTVDHPDRKPGPGMLLRAAREMLLDLSRSWVVGDMLSDVLAGRNAGCRGTIYISSGEGGALLSDHQAIDHVVKDVFEAAQVIARLHVCASTSGVSFS